tara:strand:+ start:407 stop:982 length:576 start_codon:yes stop_codon:yes gene_type:complete
MGKKSIVQILMIFFIILISWLFFLKYFKVEKNTSQNIEINDSSESSSSNFIKDINYTSVDLKGNKYQIFADEAEIDINNANIMYLKNVVGYVYMKNSKTIKITSDFGKYNTKNYDTIFSKNVIVAYPSHKITGNYLDFSLLNDIGTMSGNVFYLGDKNNLKADMIEVIISTKDTKIFMNSEKKKIIIKGKN